MKNKKLFAKNVSIVITTYNRSKFINMYLEFLKFFNFGGEVIIGNASNEKDFLILQKQIIENDYKKFQITHLHVPKKEDNVSYSMNDCFIECLKKVKTDYVFLTCDDDLVLPSSLNKLEEVLNKSKKYNGVTGDICWVGNATAISIHRQSWSILSKNPIDRLNKYIKKPFHSMFTLVRKEVLDDFVPKNFRDITFNHFAADYSWILTIVINGPIKKINSPVVFRQWHKSQLNKQKPFLDYKDFQNKSYYLEDKKNFLNHLNSVVNKRFYNDTNQKEIDKFFEKYEYFRNNSEKIKLYEKVFIKVIPKFNKAFKKDLNLHTIKEFIFGYKSPLFKQKVNTYNETLKEIKYLQNKYEI